MKKVFLFSILLIIASCSDNKKQSQRTLMDIGRLSYRHAVHIATIDGRESDDVYVQKLYEKDRDSLIEILNK